MAEKISEERWERIRRNMWKDRNDADVCEVCGIPGHRAGQLVNGLCEYCATQTETG